MALRQRGWSWSSALVGAASAAAATVVVLGRPRDPTFHLISITLSSFRLNLPLLDVDLTLTVHVTNPNLVPIHYASAIISIFYAGSHLGSALLHAGSQPAMSCQLLHLPARLYGLELAHHVPRLLADAARRQMTLDASVDISGTAQVLWWAHRFSVHVDSHVVVDPIFLDVIDQENHSETHLHLS
ncbi:unnamed protein product [Musa acuminata subsp. malaccensis]|uniref:(wild Malaysian banana) hypothetical protein n=1 Tax=Musa acuminata subsp. malaccensis TaxID=214687 RepID=A0A804HWE1_MUSAM|nr:PREDICTED: uncharacterized protein LOC103973819 [Musa acuminata subsp. malaccensis]CAG1860078.1 unnamed protein product [Musa acuminata subsp. malaccensis]